MNTHPEFSNLNRAECDALLASQRVGCLAFTFCERVDIAPMHFVHHDGCIYGRMPYGMKVDVVAHHPWVAFEEGDPTPQWELAFRIPIEEISGRAATMHGAS